MVGVYGVGLYFVQVGYAGGCPHTIGNCSMKGLFNKMLYRFTVGFMGIVLAAAVVAAVVLVLYAPPLNAQWVEQTFMVSPQLRTLDVVVDTPSVTTITVHPGEGDFSYPTAYEVFVPYGSLPSCSEWGSDPWGNDECLVYDYSTLREGVLCQYLTLTYEDEEGWRHTLAVPDDATDVVVVTAEVSCLEGETCSSNYHSDPFPRALLGETISCTLTVGKPRGSELFDPKAGIGRHNVRKHTYRSGCA